MEEQKNERGAGDLRKIRKREEQDSGEKEEREWSRRVEEQKKERGAGEWRK